MDFKKVIQEYGLEPFGRFYGIYTGIVVSDQDPDNQGRIMVQIPEVKHLGVHVWALPAGQFSGPGFGSFFIPTVNSWVYIMFRNGDPRNPVWIHGGYAKGEKPEEFETTWDLGFKSPMGHLFRLRDEEGILEYKGVKGSKVYINDETGEMKIETSKGTFIQVDESGIYLGKGGDSEPMVKGQTAVDLLGELIDIISPSDPSDYPPDTVSPPMVNINPLTLVPKYEALKIKLKNLLAKYT